MNAYTAACDLLVADANHRLHVIDDTDMARSVRGFNVATHQPHSTLLAALMHANRIVTDVARKATA